MREQRLENICRYLEKNDYLSMDTLRQMCPDVSFMTLHRDLDVLEEKGVLIKVRGGARVRKNTSEQGFFVRSQLKIEEKDLIAQKALQFIHAGSSIFIDAGTSSTELAKVMPDIDVSIFTTGPGVAMELCKLNRPSVNVCGGNINRNNMALSGRFTVDMISSVNIDVAFLGASGYSADAGFNCGKESEMLVKCKAIERARTSIVLCDTSKENRLLPFTFASFEDIDYLITDERPGEDIIQAAAKGGCKIV